MAPVSERASLSGAEIASQLRALGVQEGGVLLVHTSFRAVGPVDDGPRGLIAAMRDALGPEGTLVMPSWTGDDDQPFDPASTPPASDLGVVPGTFWRLGGVVRSDHPFACTAAGPRAQQVVHGPLPLPPHGPDSPIGQVHALDGQVLLLGVGHDANTTIHLAEVLGGAPYRVPRYCTVRDGDRAVQIAYGENDHCCARFAFVDDWLRDAGAQEEGRVGYGPARVMRARDVVEIVGSRLSLDPLLFLHPADTACSECDEARASVPAW